MFDLVSDITWSIFLWKFMDTFAGTLLIMLSLAVALVFAWKHRTPQLKYRFSIANVADLMVMLLALGAFAAGLYLWIVKGVG